MTGKKNGSKPDRQDIPRDQELRSNADIIVKNRGKTNAGSLLPAGEKVRNPLPDLHGPGMQNDKDECARDEAEALKEKYLDIYDFSPIGYCTIDARGIILEINPVGSTLLGRGRQEIVGSHFPDFLKPESRPAFEIFCRGTLKTCKKQSCDIELPGNVSNPVSVRIEGKAIPAGRGSNGLIRMAVIDITGLKGTDAALRETKEYLDNLITYANAPIMVWDPQFRITLFNHAFEHLTGRNAKEVIGQQLDSLLPEHYLTPAMDLIKKTSEGERWESVEIPILHKKGGIRTILWNSAAIFGSDGKTIVSTIAQGQDITDRKKIESAYRLRVDEYAKMNVAYKEEIAQRKLTDATLKKTLSLLNASLESTADGILVVDREGNITSYNQNFVNMWNIPRGLLNSGGELMRTDDVLNQLENPDIFVARIKDLQKNPSRESVEMIEFNDGRIFESYSKPQKIGDAVVGRVWSFRDSTDRRHAEEKLFASVQEKEVLLREIHHRVKNNLQLITDLLDMTRMRSSDKLTNDILTDMMLKIKTMGQIHTRLYESRQVGQIGLSDQFHEQAAALSDIFSHKGHEITCMINTPEIFLPVDRALPCALAVNEILSNSYKHAFKGKDHGSIEVSAVQEDGKVRITIRDDGIGIPGDLDISRTNSLGLKLVRTLVQHQLKGSLKINCRQGTETIVEFPLSLAGT